MNACFSSSTECWPIEGTIITNVAGNGEQGLKDGPVIDAHFNAPTGIVHDSKVNHTYVLDLYSNSIRLIDHEGKPEPTVSTFAHLKSKTTLPWNFILIPEACRTSDRHLVFGTMSGIYSVSSDGQTITLFAGHDKLWGFLDGPIESARFHDVTAMAIDSQNRLLICDRNNHRIRSISLAIDQPSQVITIAGSGELGHQHITHQNPFMATFHSPRGICVDDKDTIVIIDDFNHMISRIDAHSGAVTTFAGANGGWGQSDGLGGQASFYIPLCILFDQQTRNFFISDVSSIRVINSKGLVTTIVGSTYFDEDGKIVKFHYPSGMALESVTQPLHYNNWINDRPEFQYWPPGLLDIVMDYLPQIVSLLITDGSNHRIKRVCAELPWSHH